MTLKPHQRQALAQIQKSAQLETVRAKLRDCRWIEYGSKADEFRMDLGNDRRILMWREDDGINVGAMDGNRAVWDFVQGDFPDAEQAAFDCYQSLCLLADVRILPTPQRQASIDRVRRKIRRQLVRVVCEFTFVAFGYVVGLSLAVLALLSWMYF